MMTGVALAAALAVCGSSEYAVDQLLTGKRLLIVNPPSGIANNKVVFLSKDTSIALPGSALEDPRCPAAGTDSAQLTVSSVATGEGFTIGLPCMNWTVNTSGNLYKYRDTTGSTCRVVLIKANKLVKAVCKGTQVSYDLGADQVSVDVTVRTGSSPRRWCSAFNATTEGCLVVKTGADNKKYLAKNCTSGPALCGASPSGAFIEAASPF
jgi:hypothetical protein